MKRKPATHDPFIRGFMIGRDVFVAHVPERIAENHFVEEIATLPHIVGGVDQPSTEETVMWRYPTSRPPATSDRETAM